MIPSKRHTNAQAGFTLLEVMISIAILAVMMVSVYDVVDRSANTQLTILEEDRELMDLERALHRFGTDFFQIYSPLYYSPKKQTLGQQRPGAPSSPAAEDFEEQNQFKTSEKFPLISWDGLPVPDFESPDKSSFIFMSVANRRKLQDTKQGRKVWIKYSLENTTLEAERARGDYDLVRQYNPENIYSPEHRWEEVPQQVLLHHVKSLQFEYWDALRKKWVSSLRELNQQRYTLRSVRLTMEWVGPEGAIREIERTYDAMWPSYDPQQDLAIYRKVKEQERGGGLPPAPGSNNSRSGGGSGL